MSRATAASRDHPCSAHQQMDSSVPITNTRAAGLGRAFFICEQHDALTGNISLINNLLLYLLDED